MENFQIEENVDGITIIHYKTTDRYFRFDYPKKFRAYGFGGLNTKEILHPKLMAKDFSYYLSNTGICIGMLLSNDTHTRTYKFETECEEIYPDEWINLDINELGLDPNVSLYLKSLQNRVSNLTSMIKKYKEKIVELEDKECQYCEY